MPTYDVAHLNQQGQDMVIVPLGPSFGYKSSGEQASITDELQRRSSQAGLRGTVVPVWESGGQFNFIAPRPWHPFFRSIGMHHVARNLNRSLSW